jgi:segregation and condensation protein A
MWPGRPWNKSGPPSAFHELYIGFMDTTLSYLVNLEVFQGPLDLLLFLIRKKKIDIHEIPIAVITREYLEYLDRKEKINLEREGEFLLMAAVLIHIKSQMLLPRETVDGEEDDPRRLLVDRLLEYQKMKAVSSLLRERENEELKRWMRTSSPPLPDEEEIPLEEISLFDLAEIFFVLMKKKEEEDVTVISGKEFSLEEKMKEIVAVLKEKGFLEYIEYLSCQKSIEEALGAFFCLLELVKNKIVIAVQENLFQSIKVWLKGCGPA